MYKYLQGSDIAWPTSFDNEALGHRIIYLATVGMALIARYENNNVDRVWRYAKWHVLDLSTQATWTQASAHQTLSMEKTIEARSVQALES